MGKKIYISGKITGLDNEEAIYIFADAEMKLKKQGFEVINPMTLNHQHDKSWHSYMREDIKALCECDFIFMLTNWADSKGAIIEHTLAMYLGLQVIYESVQNADDISRSREQNQRMREWFEARTGLEGVILLSEHMKKIDEMLNTEKN